MTDSRRFRYAAGLAVAVALVAGSAALAGEQSERPRLDTNGDGSVDFAEMQAARPDYSLDRFNQVDADHDGLLSRDELRAAHHGRHLAKLDTDGNGSLSLDELRQRRPDLTPEDFAKLDADGDGQLNRTEMKAAHDKRRKQRESAPQEQAGGA